MAEFFHMVLAGNIGAGKTTVSRLLSERLGWRSYFERVDDNPFLADFYEDMERWAFALQLYFLTHRLEDHRLIQERGESAIQDRSIHEDALIFARNLHAMGRMADGEWATYLKLYEQVLALLRPPDLVVYLRRSLDGLRGNIRERGRDFEASIPAEYLERLNRYYEEWVDSRPSDRVLIVDADRLDFVGRPQDLDTLLARIRAACPQRDLFGDAPAPAEDDPRFHLVEP